MLSVPAAASAEPAPRDAMEAASTHLRVQAALVGLVGIARLSLARPRLTMTVHTLLFLFADMLYILSTHLVVPSAITDSPLQQLSLRLPITPVGSGAGGVHGRHQGRGQCAGAE